MATTTATITLSSADLTGDALALTATTNLNKAGTVTGLDQTTGIARQTFSQNTILTLIDKTLYDADLDDCTLGIGFFFRLTGSKTLRSLRV